MNDIDAALQQQIDKLNNGGQLQLECCGMVISVSLLHGIFIVLTETCVSPDRFCDFIQSQQTILQGDEHYLLHQKNVYYCLLMRNMDFSKMIQSAHAAVKCSMAYR